MQHKRLQFGLGFRVVLGDGHSQAAQMTIAPGDAEGGPDNGPRGAAEWLWGVGGGGVGMGEAERVGPGEGTLVLIQRGEPHEIQTTGREPLRTLNVSVPPAYTSEGEELPAGRK